ncbi:hypothetical protein JCM3770_005006, partial [Rhodotorula araucariae]
MSTAAHPETDGRAEVTNKSVGQTLRVLAEDNPDEWAQLLPLVEFALNTSISSATGLTPFETIHGFVPASMPALVAGARGPDGAFAERARLNALRATDAIIASRVSMVHQANKHRRDDAGVFRVGDLVYLSTTSLKFPEYLAGKFLPRYVGPYEIVAADEGISSYTLALPPHLKIHPTFHASRLRPHDKNDDVRFPLRSFPEPPPVVPASDHADDAEYEVEKVVAVKGPASRRLFKVRWLGYSPSADLWRPEVELRELAPDALD